MKRKKLEIRKENFKNISNISFSNKIRERITMERREVISMIEEDSFYRVTFIKSNGDIRDMLFTLSKAVMEKHNILPQGKRHYSDEKTIRVVEITPKGEAQWRSFSYDSVISLEKA